MAKKESTIPLEVADKMRSIAEELSTKPDRSIFDATQRLKERERDIANNLDEVRLKMEELKDQAYRSIVEQVAEFNALFGATLLLNFETPRERKPRTCIYCHKPGHLSKRCPKISDEILNDGSGS
jgi:hypothetical protein